MVIKELIKAMCICTACDAILKEYEWYEIASSFLYGNSRTFDDLRYSFSKPLAECRRHEVWCSEGKWLI